jgi:trimeric autotransporter adhesin
MNKWFESKNIANYAKTALLQAQKKIDQVLDIKEDEIIGISRTTSNNIPSSSSNTQDELQQDSISTPSRLHKSPSNSSIASSTASTSTSKLATALNVQVPQDTDSFFNTFLSKLDNATSSTSSLSKNELEVDNVKFDSFLNQMPSSSISPTAGTTTTVSHYVAPPTLSKKQQQRATNINKVKSNNLNIIGVNATSSNEAVDKQNWIQNYVNSSPTGVSQQHTQQQLNEENSILTNSSLLVSSSSTSSTSTTNAPVVLLSSSATSSSSTSTNTTTTIAIGLTGNTTSNEVKIKEEKEEDDNDINNNSNQEITYVSPEPLNESIEDTSLVEKFDNESMTNVKSFTESLEFVS